MPEPLNNFTPRAQQVLALARHAADLLRHEQLGTGHLLLGLLNLGQGVAVNVLRQIGVTLDLARTAVEQQVGRGSEAKPAGLIRYTPRVKKVLVLAGQEAKALKHSYIGTEHILLGILREGDGVAVRALISLGVDLARCRLEILAALDPQLSGQAEAKPAAVSGLVTTPAFTPRLLQVFGRARIIARRYKASPEIGHLVLSLLENSHGEAVNVLRRMGGDPAEQRDAVERQCRTGTSASWGSSGAHPALLPQLLVAAMEQARLHKHRYTGSAHLLLALFRYGGLAAGSGDRKFNRDEEQCRLAVVAELAATAGAETSAALPPSEQRMKIPRWEMLKAGLHHLLRPDSPDSYHFIFNQESSAQPLHNFTPRAQQVLALSRKEADRFGHNYVGTEHVLLAIIASGRGVAAKVLPKLGLDLERVRAMVEKQIGPALDRRATGNVPYTPRVKKVLALAGREAKALNHSYIGTEHMLLGLLAEGEGVAARVLKACNVNLEQCRAEILAVLGKAASPLVNEQIYSVDPAASRSSYTEHAAQALDLARREADWFHHGYVDTEHLLLALLSQRDDIALGLLQMMGVEPDTVASELQKHLAPGIEAGPPVALEATPKFKRAMNLAIEEARALQHPKVGLKHILLGLLREGDGIAARVLTNLRIDYTVLRGLCATSPEN